MIDLKQAMKDIKHNAVEIQRILQEMQDNGVWVSRAFIDNPGIEMYAYGAIDIIANECGAEIVETVKTTYTTRTINILGMEITERGEDK